MSMPGSKRGVRGVCSPLHFSSGWREAEVPRRRPEETAAAAVAAIGGDCGSEMAVELRGRKKGAQGSDFPSYFGSGWAVAVDPRRRPAEAVAAAMCCNWGRRWLGKALGQVEEVEVVAGMESEELGEANL